MNTLRTTQEAMQDHILRRDRRIATLLHSTTKVSAAARLGIYSEGYRTRLIEVLGKNFPKLCLMLGTHIFHDMALAYIEANPSQHFSARYYGHHMASFLSTELPYSNNPVLRELAQLEWTMSEVFDASEAGLMTQDGMEVIPAEHWPGLCFALHPSVNRVELAWNTVEIWLALNKGEDPPTSRVLPTDTHWLLWRHNLTTYFRPLEIDEAWALGAIACGHTFEHLCEGMRKWVSAEDVPVNVSEKLKRWLADGLITAVV